MANPVLRTLRAVAAAEAEAPGGRLSVECLAARIGAGGIPSDPRQAAEAAGDDERRMEAQVSVP